MKVSAISRRLIEGHHAVGHQRVIPSDGWPRSRLRLVENLQESALRHGHFAGEVQLRKARIAVRNAIRAWYRPVSRDRVVDGFRVIGWRYRGIRAHGHGLADRVKGR